MSITAVPVSTGTSAGVAFRSRTDAPDEQPTPWRPVKVTAAQIEQEIERLAALPKPANGRRATALVHPEATAPGLGFTPGIEITIEVLLPGESTVPRRCNSSQVVIGIQGRGQVQSGDRTLVLARWDVCNLPSMATYSFTNDSDEVWARLVYSNVPLLRKLGAAFAQTVDGPPAAPVAQVETSDAFNRSSAPDFSVSDLGSRVRGYEYLVDIEVVENHAEHWPWATVSGHLAREKGDGKRTILAYYNPSTERRNGATHSFFVTAVNVPPGVPEIPEDSPGHRHNSVAVNYHFRGSGKSVVDGESVEWAEGDLVLSAPGWLEHLHIPGPEGTSVFTIQDHPLHIGMESLIWQEDLTGPILTLGTEAGLTGYVGPREVGR